MKKYPQKQPAPQLPYRELRVVRVVLTARKHPQSTRKRVVRVVRVKVEPKQIRLQKVRF